MHSRVVRWVVPPNTTTPQRSVALIPHAGEGLACLYQTRRVAAAAA